VALVGAPSTTATAGRCATSLLLYTRCLACRYSRPSGCSLSHCWPCRLSSCSHPGIHCGATCWEVTSCYLCKT
jgi:hypothetical protein